MNKQYQKVTYNDIFQQKFHQVNQGKMSHDEKNALSMMNEILRFK